MPDDGVIRIGTEVDISGLKSRMTEAADVVKQSTSQMESAYEQLATATANYAGQTATLRDAIKQLTTGAIPYTETTKILVPILMEQTTASRALTEAKTKLAAIEKAAAAAVQAETAALTSNTLAQTAAALGATELSTATGGMTSKFYAAQGASALLAGRVPIRAFERFLSVIPMVNEALSLAFPIIGAIALVEVVGEGISKIRKLEQQAEEAADNIDLAFRRMSDEIRASNESLITQSDRLQEELDKLLGRPGQNSLRIAFDEDAESADKLGVSIDRDIDKMRQLLDVSNKKDSIGFWASFWSGKAETKDTQTTIDKAVKGIQEMNDSYTDLIAHTTESGNKANLQQAEEDRLAGLEEAYKKATGTISTSLDKARHAQDVYEESGKTFGEDQTANIKMLEGALRELGLEQKNIGQQFANSQLQQKVTPLREAHGAGVADNAAARKQLQEIESQFDALNQKESALKGHGMTAGEGLAFWAEYLNTFKSGSEEAKHVMEQYVRAQDEFHKQLEAIVKSAKKSAESDVHEEGLGPGLTKWIAAGNNDILQTGEAWKSYHDALARGEEITAQMKAQTEEAKVKVEESTGTITALGAAQQIAAIHAEEYRVKLKALNDELDRLKKEGTYDALGNNTDSKNAAQQQQIQNQIMQTKGQATTSGITDQAAIQQQIASPYLKAFDSINQGWLRVQNQMMYSTRNLSLEFAKMGQQILISIVDNIERAALVTIEKELVMTLAHTAAVSQRVATDASGAAASTAISKASGMEQGIQAAKLAFKNTYATVSQWPVVGPILAPVLASAAFVAVAAFEEGTGYVPRDGMAYLHEGEAVVPAPTVDELRGSSGGSDVHIHQENHWNGMIPDGEFKRQLDRHAGQVARAVQKHIRQTGRG
jgi:hypothetical protein